MGFGSYVREFWGAILMRLRFSLPWCFPIRQEQQQEEKVAKALFLVIAFLCVKIVARVKMLRQKGCLLINLPFCSRASATVRLPVLASDSSWFFGAVDARSTRRTSVHMVQRRPNEPIFDTELLATDATMVNVSGSNRRCYNTFAERTNVYVLRLGCCRC